jgi:hypothetical protein
MQILDREMAIRWCEGMTSLKALTPGALSIQIRLLYIKLFYTSSDLIEDRHGLLAAIGYLKAEKDRLLKK